MDIFLLIEICSDECLFSNKCLLFINYSIVVSNKFLYMSINVPICPYRILILPIFGGHSGDLLGCRTTLNW